MRIALSLEYDGYDFYGWQSQKNLVTVQATLEQALSQIANESIITFCAGRTDAGVHALQQVIHFDTQTKRELKAWILGVNSLLPSSIAVQWAQETNHDFHARFSATARTYRYVIYQHKTRSAHLANKALWYPKPLNINAMNSAASYLIGEQDFSSFRSSQCESKSPRRHIYFVRVSTVSRFTIIEIRANAFLHHMVRNIVGVLLQIGSGEKPIDWMQYVIQARDRKQASITAPACGLYLYEVTYPDSYLLPTMPKSDYIFDSYI